MASHSPVDSPPATSDRRAASGSTTVLTAPRCLHPTSLPPLPYAGQRADSWCSIPDRHDPGNPCGPTDPADPRRHDDHQTRAVAPPVTCPNLVPHHQGAGRVFQRRANRGHAASPLSELRSAEAAVSAHLPITTGVDRVVLVVVAQADPPVR